MNRRSFFAAVAALPFVGRTFRSKSRASSDVMPANVTLPCRKTGVGEYVVALPRGAEIRGMTITYTSHPGPGVMFIEASVDGERWAPASHGTVTLT